MKNQTHNNIQSTGTQKRWKLPLIVSGIILCIWYLASVILTSEESSTPVIPVNTGIQYQSPSVSVIPLNTGIYAPSPSGTKELPPCNLINPFSGATDCKKEEKPKFIKPNTQWKTRTLSGITYVFGEGNPREVALSKGELQNIRKKCGNQSDPDSQGYLCKEGDGYITPEVENYLKVALSDPNWEKFAGCFHPSERISYILEPNFLDINTFLIINTQTGRKELDVMKITRILDDLKNSVYPPEDWPEDAERNTCMSTYGTRIYDTLWEAYTTYISL